MNDILTKQIDTIINNKKLIKEKITKLFKEEIEEDEKLSKIENTLNISISTCKTCRGTGEISDSSGYGGCSISYCSCSKCNGKGYVIKEKEGFNHTKN